MQFLYPDILPSVSHHHFPPQPALATSQPHATTSPSSPSPPLARPSPPSPPSPPWTELIPTISCVLGLTSPQSLKVARPRLQLLLPRPTPHHRTTTTCSRNRPTTASHTSRRKTILVFSLILTIILIFPYPSHQRSNPAETAGCSGEPLEEPGAKNSLLSLRWLFIPQHLNQILLPFPPTLTTDPRCPKQPPLLDFPLTHNPTVPILSPFQLAKDSVHLARGLRSQLLPLPLLLHHPRPVPNVVPSKFWYHLPSSARPTVQQRSLHMFVNFYAISQPLDSRSDASHSPQRSNPNSILRSHTRCFLSTPGSMFPMLTNRTLSRFSISQPVSTAPASATLSKPLTKLPGTHAFAVFYPSTLPAYHPLCLRSLPLTRTTRHPLNSS